MFWLIDSRQNSVSGDRYHLTISRAQVSTHWVGVFFWSYPLSSCFFLKDRRLKFNFFKYIWNKSCLWAAFLKFWFQTDLGRENLTRFIHAGKAIAFNFFHHNHALITRALFMLWFGQNLTGEFMRNIYAASGNLLLTEFCVIFWCF